MTDAGNFDRYQAESQATHDRVGAALRAAGMAPVNTTWRNDAAPSWGIDAGAGEYRARIFCGSWECGDTGEITVICYDVHEDGAMAEAGFHTLKDPDAVVAIVRAHLGVIS